MTFNTSKKNKTGDHYFQELLHILEGFRKERDSRRVYEAKAQQTDACIL